MAPRFVIGTGKAMKLAREGDFPKSVEWKILKTNHNQNLKKGIEDAADKNLETVYHYILIN